MLENQLPDCFRVNPEMRLCSQFDSWSMKVSGIPDPGKMGFLVQDNFPEEHIQ